MSCFCDLHLSFQEQRLEKSYKPSAKYSHSDVTHAFCHWRGPTGGVPCRLLSAMPSLSHYLAASEGGCLSSRFHCTHCRYFLGHVTCRNLPWQGLIEGHYWILSVSVFTVSLQMIKFCNKKSAMSMDNIAFYLPFYPTHPILGDPGADSAGERKSKRSEK